MVLAMDGNQAPFGWSIVITIIIAIIIINKRGRLCNWLGEIDLHPISPKTPAPQYQLRQKEDKGKIVEDKNG